MTSSSSDSNTISSFTPICSDKKHVKMDMYFPKVPLVASTFLTMSTTASAGQAMPLPCPSEGSMNLYAEPSKRRKVSDGEDAQTLLPRSRKRPRKPGAKSVRFFKDSELTTTVVFETTEEDIENAWYGRVDYLEMQEDSQSTAMAFELNILDLVPPEDACFRGLEAHLSSNKQGARNSVRKTMIRLILRTEELQRGHGMLNDELIRGLSIMLSRDSRADALKLATLDASEAREIYNTETKNR